MKSKFETQWDEWLNSYRKAIDLEIEKQRLSTQPILVFKSKDVNLHKTFPVENPPRDFWPVSHERISTTIFYVFEASL